MPAENPFESIAKASSVPVASPKPSLGESLLSVDFSGYNKPGRDGEQGPITVKVQFGSIFWPIVAAWAVCGVVTSILIALIRAGS